MALLISLAIVAILNLSLGIGFGLRGITIRLACYNNPPYDYLTRQNDGNYTYTGSSIKILGWLAQRANFTINIFPVDDKALIAKMGPFDAGISKIVAKEADGLGAGLVINLERSKTVDYASMMWTEPYTLIVPKPGEQSRLFAFIRPFQPMVWIYLFISILVGITMMSGFSWIYQHDVQNKKWQRNTNQFENTYKSGTSVMEKISLLEQVINSLSYYGVYIVNILTNHGIYIPYAQHSFRILAGCWLLAGLVLVNSYSSIVVSSLTVPTMKPAVNSFEDLITNEEVTMILRKDFAISGLILNAVSGVFKILAEETRKHPDRLFLDQPSLVKKILTGQHAFPFLKTFNRDIILQQFKKEGKCRLQLSDPLQISTGYFCMILKKNFPNVPVLTRGLTDLWQTGLNRYWVENDIPYAYQCLSKNKKPNVSAREAGIKLEDLSSAFLILGLGIGVSLLSFVFEVINGTASRTRY